MSFVTEGLGICNWSAARVKVPASTTRAKTRMAVIWSIAHYSRIGNRHVPFSGFVGQSFPSTLHALSHSERASP